MVLTSSIERGPGNRLPRFGSLKQLLYAAVSAPMSASAHGGGFLVPQPDRDCDVVVEDITAPSA
jgi:hypothetical protein